ncbi:MAG: polysaccharide biosynthesis C-terminal domain-containing protein, partial [Butyrivibrio sp.]|nr:polysaccharide biosynthesis C-terminal domain-containing protein [Butyrivibrio sp.]
LFKDNNKNEMNRYYSLSLDYLFLFALPMMAGCIICSDDFVPVFFGPGYEPTRILLKLLSSLFVVLGMGQLIGSVLSAINKQKQVTFATIIGAFTNFVLNMILIRRFASVGAVIASIVAELVVTSIDLLFLKSYFSLKCVCDSFLRYLFPTLIMSGVILMVRLAPLNNVIVLLSAEVLLGVVSYFIVLLKMKDHMIQYVLNTIKHHKP